MTDYFIRGIDKSGRIRILVGTTTKMVEEARKIHQTSPTATAALGRALTAGALMGAMMKNQQDRLTLRIAGDGPAGNILVVARNDGKVKGEMTNPQADVPSRPDGKLDVGGLVGRNGTITTIMDLGLREPYIGQSQLVSGEIAEDLANYYYYSEQKPSAVSLGVLVDKDISVKAAGGYIIQLLPGISDQDIDKIERSLAKIQPVSSLVDNGLSPEEIMTELLQDFSMEVLERRDLSYECDCSRERIERGIISLGKEEIKSIIEEEGQAEVVCHFCNTKYQFSKEDLEKFLIDI
ncbi:MAG TPA: Hsp33 family molecular chaperone HslO [Tissierellaceae bacterium]|nr:Hsp33 family molecular chaperone HslO [Tissierellaceae bacterium]